MSNNFEFVDELRGEKTSSSSSVPPVAIGVRLDANMAPNEGVGVLTDREVVAVERDGTNSKSDGQSEVEPALCLGDPKGKG